MGYPNTAAWERVCQASDQLSYHPTSVDATRFPAELTGFRTIFTSFHHFPRDLCIKILQDAVDQEQGIGVFELQDRSAQSVATVATATPMMVMGCTPVLRPFEWKRLLLT